MPTTAAHKAVAGRQARRGTTKPTAAPDDKNNVIDVVESEVVEKFVQVAQFRLRPEESRWLSHSMLVFDFKSTSDALREALRLLHREATEVEAAERIRAFYQGKPAPLPEGVMPVDEEDLLAADNAEW